MQRSSLALCIIGLISLFSLSGYAKPSPVRKVAAGLVGEWEAKKGADGVVALTVSSGKNIIWTEGAEGSPLKFTLYETGDHEFLIPEGHEPAGMPLTLIEQNGANLRFVRLVSEERGEETITWSEEFTVGKQINNRFTLTLKRSAATCLSRTTGESHICEKPTKQTYRFRRVGT